MGAFLFVVLLTAAAVAPGGAAFAASPMAFERYSVLTPAGPEEPRPEILARSRRLLYAEHRVRPGQWSASLIAKDFGTTLEALRSTNNDEFVAMYPGSRMTVLNRDGMLYRVRKQGETLDQVVARYKVGAAERRKFKEIIVRANNLPGIALLTSYELQPGERILIPGIKTNFDNYRFPFESAYAPRISSSFGYRRHPIRRTRRFHEGLDIPKPYGTPVYAAKSGRVIQAGWHEGYGQLIVIKHPNGETTRYGHLSKITVKEGDVVQRGKTMIGRVGSTGLSTGPHLHFEVRRPDGKAVNPYALIMPKRRK